MPDIQTAVISGRLVRDAELKHLDSGTAVANFSIASSAYAGQGKDDYTNYFDCVLWGKRAEGLAQYLTKGKPVMVVCEPRQERWEKGDEKRSRVKFTVLNLTFQQGSKDSGGSSGGSRKEYADEPTTGDGSDTEVFEDDIPF